MNEDFEIDTPAADPPVSHTVSRFALAALGLALTLGLLGILAALGTRWGLWSYFTGLNLVRWVAYGGIVAFLVSAVAAYHTRPASPHRGFIIAVGALLLSLLVIAVPWRNSRAAAGAPPIHDISTDLVNPPEFVAIAPLRADALNPIAHGGEEVARLQRAAYPDIRPVVLDLSPDRAYQRALDVAEARGWEIVSTDPIEGRIEATDRTFWFGRHEDVVVRITPLDSRAVLDVRSSSREGQSDGGTNARRVRSYILEVVG